MIIEMRRNYVTRNIICRMLYGSKGINLLPNRKNNDTTRVLSCRSTYSNAARYDTVYFTVTFIDTLILEVILDISIGRLIRQCSDGSSLEGLAFTKNDFCITMCLRLIFIREVQIDIRLLVALESQEGFERNIKSFFG